MDFKDITEMKDYLIERVSVAMDKVALEDRKPVPEIVINPRLRTTYARVFYDDNRMEFNPTAILSFSAEDIEGLIGHELCHCLAPRNAKHGPKFKAMCKKIGVPRKWHNAHVNVDATSEYKWEVRDKDTGKFIKGYHRLTQQTLFSIDHNKYRLIQNW